MNTNKIYAESIVNEYSRKEDSKVVRLKKLDHKVKTPANIFAYTFGIFAALILGTGMCLSMGVLGAGSTPLFIVGVIIGILGIIGCSINYPIYKKILNNAKAKYASDIISLANQIVQEGE